MAPRLGFKGSKTPAVSTLHLVFKRLDRLFQEWAQEELGDRAQAVAIDGKSLRGSWRGTACIRYMGSNWA